MTSYKIKNKFLSKNAIVSNGESKNKADSLLRARNNNSSGSSIMSSSSDSSSASTNEFLSVKIIFPNGSETVKKIESKKAIYDLLIELSASAKLIPTNYTLKLYNQDENINDDKLIEYTPNQTIGQLNPIKIKILPKTATLKHQHISQESYSNKTLVLMQSRTQSENKSQQPFELTTCVEVNLPFNQKTIVRVKREIKLDDLFDLICKEANLERHKYDLVISNRIDFSMQDSFEMFNTKEVCLLLKRQNDVNSPQTLNSKSTHSIFVQNSAKFRLQSKHIHQNNTNAKENLLRSKSEIDINLESNSLKNSNNTSNNNMLGMFSRNKKTNEPKSKVVLPPEQNLPDNFITPSKLTAKKKPAPPPPPPPMQPKLNDTTDTIEISKLINSTKNKAPAPPPPPIPTFQTPPIEKEVSITIEKQSDNTQLKIETNFENSPQSNHSSDYSSASSTSSVRYQDNQKMTSSSSTSPPLPESSNYSVPSSPSSSTGRKSIANSLIMPVVKTHIHYNEAVQNYHKSIQPYSSPLSSPPFSNKKIESLDNKAISRKLSMQSTSSDIEDSLENSVTSSSSSKIDKYDQHHSHEIESIAENDFSVDSINNNTINSNLNNNNNKMNSTNDVSFHSSNTSIYKNEKSIDESMLATNMKGKFYGKLSDQKTFSEDDFSDLESLKAANSPSIKYNSLESAENNLSRYQQYLKYDEFSIAKTQQKLGSKSNNIEKFPSDYSIKNDLNNNLNETIKSEDFNNNKLHETKKRKPASEVRPEFSTSLLSFIHTAEPNNYVKAKSVNPVKESPSFKDDQSVKPQFLRSPTSPLPQFPAIGENEISEQHQNYTVVRSGEIIEKNGTYYSTDGTIRGYSGTVKKIANSKTLNEIFTKQQELEQQHERDYQIELEQKQKQDDEMQKKMNSLERNKQSYNIAKRQSLPQQGVSNSFIKGRTSLGNIIMLEKNANNNYKSNTMSNYSNIFRQQTKQSDNLNENELTKKLEERANKIAAAANKPLQIDTNLKPLETTSNSHSTVSSSSSNSYNNTTASYTTQASWSSANASSAMLSPGSPTSNRIGYTKIYDLKNEIKNQDSNSTSSSSSLSTFSYELITNKLFQNQTKPSTSSKTANSNKNSLNKKPNIDYHSMLLNEIKSVVPLVDDINNNKIKNDNSLIKVSNPALIMTSTPPPPPPNPPQVLNQNSLVQTKSPPPVVAPKNFSSDALKSLNKKTQVINQRDNLMDSIKSFSVSSLRKTLSTE